MTTTLIERMAKAILKARYYDIEPDMWENLDVFYGDLSGEELREVIPEARAALEAMKSPTDVMIDAGYSPNYSSSKEVWQAMLSAALNEEQEE